jgi:GDP-L-fucose synthase
MNILVTGGSGMVGKSISNLVIGDPKETRVPSSCGVTHYTFLSSSDCDLRDQDKVDQLFTKYKPDVVIHCASVVAGLYGNMSNNYTMLVDNLKINTNVLESCRKHKVRRLVNILSSCVFGDDVSYPLTSDQILNCVPDKSNEGYSYSKRLLYTGSKLLSKCCEIDVINLTPTNLYGGNGDNYNLENGHVLPVLVRKIYEAKQNCKELVVKGNGSAVRQFVHAHDFAKIILHFVKCDLPKRFNSLIVGPPVEDEISIKDLVNKLIGIFDFKGEVVYDSSFSNGQHKKTVSNDELLAYIPDFKFTSLDDGLKKTINYFIENYDTVRK